MTLYTFRIHFSDGTALDAKGYSAADARAEAMARKIREIQRQHGHAAPLPRIEKTKLLREA